MKRTILIILTIAIILSMPLVVSASDSVGNIVNVGSFTIVFEADSGFTVDEQHALAQIIATDSENDTSTSYNVLCTLFGHKTSTETISVIEHCVSDTQPRCIQSYMDVTACSRCDYADIVELSSIYIYCCE